MERTMIYFIGIAIWLAISMVVGVALGKAIRSMAD
jgi:hypothetical protein